MTCNNQKGFVIFYALVLVGVMLFIISTTINSAVSELKASGDELESLKAFYAADSAIECVRYYQETAGAFNTSVAQASYNCGYGADFNAGGTASPPYTPTVACTDRVYMFPVSGFENGSCVDVTVTTKPHVDTDAVCVVTTRAEGKNTCGGGSAVIAERTRWEEWVGLATGSGDVTVGLIGHWRFDEGSGTNADDSSPNDNDGTLFGAIKPAWEAGQIGDALDFDSDNDPSYVNIGSPVTLNDIRPISISAWIYPRTMGANNIGQVISKASFSTGRWRWGFVYNNWRLSFQKAFDNNTLMENRMAWDSIAPNTWQHIAVTWDGSEDPTKVHQYVNGKEIVPVDLLIGNLPIENDAGSFLRIGTGSQGDAFDGLIDDVRIYDRILHPIEVRQLCLNGGGLCQ